ncbi:MAG TPA: hypothetical protein VFN23_20355 [Ktedonobacteraceae bacterium]|nr:hypothetical protein [Ktedonobacteraceae bacterium]
MKQDHTGAFSIILIEATDDKEALKQVVGEQKKPIVIVLPEKTKAFQRPEDFSDLKYLKRQLDTSISFVIPYSEYLALLASRQGFPVYTSTESFTKALAQGHIVTPSRSSRITVPLSPMAPVGRTFSSPLPPLETFTPPPPPKKKKSFPFLSLILALIILVMGSSTIGYVLYSTHQMPDIPGLNSFNAPGPNGTSPNIVAPAPIKIVGHVYFQGSGQINELTNQGINDEVQVELDSLNKPTPGNSYYAWLLSDKNLSDIHSILLGTINVVGGKGQMQYGGDAQHTNLLALYSRFLVTEEPGNVVPLAPTPDQQSWRYVTEFNQTPNPNDTVHHFSMLDHLRHLLASDPTLNKLNLPGGLDNWLYRNTSKLLEWSDSARDNWGEGQNPQLLRRQVVRILDYLDGVSYVKNDVPPNTPLEVPARNAQVGIIDFAGADQQPPSYLYHIITHLNGMVLSPGATIQTRETVAQIITAMNNIKAWLAKARDDAKQLVKMSDTQLLQPQALTLLNDLSTQVNYAFSGQVDPVTNQVQGGVVWIHRKVQTLVNLNITAYNSSTSAILSGTIARRRS